MNSTLSIFFGFFYNVYVLQASFSSVTLTSLSLSTMDQRRRFQAGGIYNISEKLKCKPQVLIYTYEGFNGGIFTSPHFHIQGFNIGMNANLTLILPCYCFCDTKS